MNVPLDGFLDHLEDEGQGGKTTRPCPCRLRVVPAQHVEIRNPMTVEKVERMKYLANLTRQDKVPDNEHENEGDDEAAWLPRSHKKISLHFSELPPPKDRIQAPV